MKPVMTISKRPYVWRDSRENITFWHGRFPIRKPSRARVEWPIIGLALGVQLVVK